jgi:hypothetical protein
MRSTIWRRSRCGVEWMPLPILGPLYIFPVFAMLKGTSWEACNTEERQ